jgi:hypothetical protein
LFFSSSSAFSINLFQEFALPGMPISSEKPDWVSNQPTLKLEYSFDEYYKRWLDDSLINDFSGYRFKTEISAQFTPGVLAGVRKKFFERQKWVNKIADKAESFDIDSDSESGEVFLRFRRKNATLEIGRGSSKSLFSGQYDLHPDVVAALGKNPPVYLNNGATHSYAKGFYANRRVNAYFNWSSEKAAHTMKATTPALDIAMNLDRKIETREFEISWQPRRTRFSPFFRFYQHHDNGSGSNFKDVKFKFGDNRGEFDLRSRALGVCAPYKSTDYFFEYALIDCSFTAATSLNLITLNPLFLFGTNQTDYALSFFPDRGEAIRLGATRKYRGIDYSGQYSLTRLKGKTNLDSTKFYNFFKDTDADNTVNQTRLDLHRLQFKMKKPDKSGAWQAIINLMVPVADYEELKAAPAAPAPQPGPSKPPVYKPEEEVRGGWQIVISREFYL